MLRHELMLDLEAFESLFDGEFPAMLVLDVTLAPERAESDDCN